MPTPAPSKNFVAKKEMKDQNTNDNAMECKIITDITPNGDGVEKVACPNQTIDEFNETGERNPKHVDACACIPGL